MRFKIRYSGNMWKNFSNAVMVLEYSLVDSLIALLIDISLFFFILLGFGKIYYAVTGVVEVPSDVSKSILASLVIIELIIIIIIECKRRNTYVSIDYRGVYVYNNNGMKFGVGQWYRRNAVIPFGKIVKCYSEVPKNVPKNYRYQYFAVFKHFARDFNQIIGKENSPYYLPAVSRGRFDEECVILELTTGKSVVLPIDECKQFVDLYNQYIGRISKGN